MAVLLSLIIALVLLPGAVALASYGAVSLTYWFEFRRLRSAEHTEAQPAR